ncbi:unnamed protein product [Fusarium venenatum]|uniref:Uncharacterized protein n=1 Tax=Fusarium venenatum TaxID=56646 RepID=A0A2L2T1U0_9HYPO|nr:uncharacterized protein FVRRES_01076 [Fusarium venenatum]CEI64564.1 unnamed protein product [Fusarium venenatum]
MVPVRQSLQLLGLAAVDRFRNVGYTASAALMASRIRAAAIYVVFHQQSLWSSVVQCMTVASKCLSQGNEGIGISVYTRSYMVFNGPCWLGDRGSDWQAIPKWLKGPCSSWSRWQLNFQSPARTPRERRDRVSYAWGYSVA